MIDKVHRISKECDRRWEDGEDADALEFEPPNYDRNEERDSRGYRIASEKFIRRIKKIGIRKLVKLGCSRKILQTICRKELVRNSTLSEYERRINLQVHS